MLKEFLNEEDMLNKIKETILNEYPILEDRMDTLFDDYKEFQIAVSFLKDKNDDDITRIIFMNGDDRNKKSIGNMLLMKGLLSLDALKDLILFLSDGNVMDIENKLDTKFNLSFCVSMCDDNMRGMGCNKFILSLGTVDYPNHFSNDKEIIDNYFNFITEIFYEELKDTQYMQNSRYLDYQNKMEEKIASFSDEELNLFISLLNIEERRNMLMNMNPYIFDTIFSNFENRKKNQQLVKK